MREPLLVAQKQIFDGSWRVDDLGGLPGRAAGGLPVQDFKFACVLRALDEVPPDSHFVWSARTVRVVGPFEENTDRENKVESSRESETETAATGGTNHLGRPLSLK